MKNFTIGISRGLKKELDQVGEELKDKLMLQQVSYDRVIRELFVHYRKTYLVPEKPKHRSRPRPKAQLGAMKPSRPKPKSKPRSKNSGQPETEKLILASTPRAIQ